MQFIVGDRIQAKQGICPGSFGVVTGHKGAPTGSRDDVLNVTYDSGKKDHIFAYMLELVDRDSFDID